MDTLVIVNAGLNFSLARMPIVHFGPGKLRFLPSLAAAIGKKALLVTGSSSLKASGRLDPLLAGFKSEGVEAELVVIGSEPSTSFIDGACARYRDSGFKVVIGIGGGSVIDGAKAISAMLPHANSIEEHLEDVGKDIPHCGIKVPYIAVPTTSGTGGEATKNAVISKVGPGGYKKSLRHDNLIPDLVLVDPELLVSCPRLLTAACGMDAFTQLLEPFLSPTATPFTDAIAISGLEKIRDNLLPACSNEAYNTRVRGNMAYASLLSGVALANAGLGIVHGLASPIGGFFDIPHGVVCGTLVAAATRKNIEVLRKKEDPESLLHKFARVGELLHGKTGQGKAYHCDALVDCLEAWTAELALPRLGRYGISEKDFDRILDKTSNRNNPVKLERNEIREVLQARL